MQVQIGVPYMLRPPLKTYLSTLSILVCRRDCQDSANKLVDRRTDSRQQYTLSLTPFQRRHARRSCLARNAQRVVCVKVNGSGLLES